MGRAYTPVLTPRAFLIGVRLDGSISCRTCCDAYKVSLKGAHFLLERMSAGTRPPLCPFQVSRDFPVMRALFSFLRRRHPSCYSLICFLFLPTPSLCNLCIGSGRPKVAPHFSTHCCFRINRVRSVRPSDRERPRDHLACPCQGVRGVSEGCDRLEQAHV